MDMWRAAWGYSALLVLQYSEWVLFLRLSILSHKLWQVESNGTVLSTNWKDVGKKKIEGSAPTGMEMKKWELWRNRHYGIVKPDLDFWHSRLEIKYWLRDLQFLKETTAWAASERWWCCVDTSKSIVELGLYWTTIWTGYRIIILYKVCGIEGVATRAWSMAKILWVSSLMDTDFWSNVPCTRFRFLYEHLDSFHGYSWNIWYRFCEQWLMFCIGLSKCNNHHKAVF